MPIPPLEGRGLLYYRPPAERWAALPALAAALLERFNGVLDSVPAYESIYIEYDPRQVTAEELLDWLAATQPEAAGAGRTVELPILYNGEDLPEMAQFSGLSETEAVRRHSSETYRVRALGFVAGFPFMETTPPELQMPRRADPRPAVPPHSLGVAGKQTGIYPVTAPGGWNLIGQALEAVYDPTRAQPFLLKPGDQVQFRAADHEEGDPPPALQAVPLWPERPQWPALRVLKVGALGLMMDTGRFRSGHLGLVRSGSLDTQAATLANALLDNPPDAALLELHLTGPEFQALRDVQVALTGPALRATTAEGEQRPYSSFTVRAGDTLRLTPTGQGRLAYLAVRGGFETQPFMGSASSDLRAALGRPLKAGDELGLAAALPPAHPHHFEPFMPPLSTVRLRLLPLADNETLGETAAALFGQQYQLTDLNRMAARLSGPPITGGEQASEAAPVGTVQVPPSGVPLVLLNDKGTLGGYRTAGRVHPADLPRLVQARTGSMVQFVPNGLF